MVFGCERGVFGGSGRDCQEREEEREEMMSARRGGFEKKSTPLPLLQAFELCSLSMKRKT